MKRFFYAFISIVIMNACSEKKEQVLVDVPVLHASEIYFSNDVTEYIQKYGTSHHDIAVSYLNKAHAIKDKDLKKAIYFVKRSITLEPKAESYQELIELLSEDKNYSEATRAYGILARATSYTKDGEWAEEYVFSKPDENTRMDYIIMSILAGEGVSYYSLSDNGIDKQKIRARLIADERFNYDSSNIEHKNIMVNFWSAEEIDNYKKSLTNLNALLRSVSDTSAVFEINQKNVGQFRYDDFNGVNYSQEFYEEDYTLAGMAVYYLKEKQDDPDKWIQYNINHSFHPHPQLSALVYAIDTSATACPIEMRELYHRLVIYNADGKVVSDKIVAFQSGEHLQTVMFNKDHFEVSEYKRSWKKAYKKQDFDNEIINTQLLSKKSYTITPTGEIVETVSQ